MGGRLAPIATPVVQVTPHAALATSSLAILASAMSSEFGPAFETQPCCSRASEVANDRTAPRYHPQGRVVPFGAWVRRTTRSPRTRVAPLTRHMYMYIYVEPQAVEHLPTHCSRLWYRLSRQCVER